MLNLHCAGSIALAQGHDAFVEHRRRRGLFASALRAPCRDHILDLVDRDVLVANVIDAFHRDPPSLSGSAILLADNIGE